MTVKQDVYSEALAATAKEFERAAGAILGREERTEFEMLRAAVVSSASATLAGAAALACLLEQILEEVKQ